MNVPVATYRLQFNHGFRFQDAEALVPYLKRLGVSHVYASPIFAARPGSTHGYDVTDPTRLNSELGTEEDFERLLTALRREGLGLVLDIVPNHMAADSRNPWWRDVLTYGRASRYASYFDIDWEGGGGKLVLPVLGKPLDEALAAGEIGIATSGPLPEITYFDKHWPISPESHDLVPRETGDTGALRALLDAQVYRLVHWNGEPPNYRRFFDINHLAAVRVEDDEVFHASHVFILDLVRRGAVSGLRVDHVDGLYDPLGYLRQLREAVGPDIYIVVEKVLGEDEALPPDWPVEGTTGYDFLSHVNGLFVSDEGLRSLSKAYARFTGIRHGFEAEVRQQKLRVLEMLFSNEVAALARRFAAILSADFGLSASIDDIGRVISEVTAELPVYRTYADETGMPASGRRLVRRAFGLVRRRGPEVDDELLKALSSVMTLDYPHGLPEPISHDWLDAVMRWQQISGPATAKGMEDTAFYRYNRLIALNEVGGHAEASSPDEVHRYLQRRARDWPHSMNASSTHDTKRSEDMRARLQALSWMAEEWASQVEAWRHRNAQWRRSVEGEDVPDANTEWMLYQTLVGLWPLNSREEAELLPRIQGFLTKAAREAKEHTSWLDVNEPYEQALLAFAETLLDEQQSGAFLREVRQVVGRIAPLGAVASLAAVTIKALAPGVPDFYQGQELWDFSLTDPDNRRPVDYGRRQRLLDDGGAGADVVQDLLDHWRNGRIKLYVTLRLLQVRHRYESLLADGTYVPLPSGGGEELFAFMRRRGQEWLLVAVPRALGAAPRGSQLPLGKDLAGDSYLVLPKRSPAAWSDVFTGTEVTAQDGKLEGRILLRSFPVAVLVGRGAV